MYGVLFESFDAYLHRLNRNSHRIVYVYTTSSHVKCYQNNYYNIYDYVYNNKSDYFNIIKIHIPTILSPKILLYI